MTQVDIQAEMLLGAYLDQYGETKVPAIITGASTTEYLVFNVRVALPAPYAAHVADKG